MQQIDNELFTARANELRERVRNELGNTAVAMMQLRIIDCDAQEMSMTIAYPALPWEKNPDGVIHGGIVGTMFDTSMGIAAYAVTGGMTPTISLTTNFLRPAPGDGTLIVRARVTKAGRAVIYAEAEMWDSRAPEKPVATAQGIFRNRES